ncbi:hypothetical protein [Arthrobacter sp. ISL-69]|uniref:hypothetical protein n=1 Tax=Arthrobacter sp. ISL-69 TaxID=2819113 RepID=UPI001BEAC724|nr:hypothetical protein [Arthrobacter sp. ISL-69]MBT2537187.1 hypothetical protein [Arthrobacter sp. ISL-69]
MAAPMMPAWISDLITVSPILGGIGLAGFIVWKVAPVFRKWSRFIDRVTGVPADPKTGQHEVLGLFERMDHQDAKLEEHSAATTAQSLELAEQSAVLETIRHEVEFNNGSSVKDAVTRIEKQLDDHLTQPTTTINVNPGGPE